MKTEKILEKLNKLIKKEKKIKKIILDILKDNKIEKNTEEIIEKVLNSLKEFNFEESFLEEYSRSSDKDIEEIIQEIDDDKEDFIKKLLSEQVKLITNVLQKENYLKELENNNTKLKEENFKLEGQLKEYIELCSRLKKDYENLTKRTEKEKKSIEQNSSKKVCASVIEILDNFNLAIDSFKKIDSDKIQKEKVLEGLEKIEKKFVDILQKEGVSQISALNTLFDHNVHEALTTEERDDIDEDDTVVEEFRTGYMFKDDVLRPSLVKVGKKVSNKKEKSNK